MRDGQGRDEVREQDGNGRDTDGERNDEWLDARRNRDPGDAKSFCPPPAAPRPVPAHHEHKHTQKLRQALSAQLAAEPEAAFDSGQGPAVGHGEDRRAHLPPSVRTGTQLLTGEVIRK